MRSGPNKNTPRVEFGKVRTFDTFTQNIVIDSPDWFWFLRKGTKSFYFENADGTFTARREKRQRGDEYWFAYRKQFGRLTSMYIGKSDEITLEKLNDTCEKLNEKIYSGKVKRR